jgi:putative Ca2+/H+ antiporter (TMEM165/GDT1 family)
MKELLTIFVSVFIAELGDKTQLATMLFAADHSVGKAGVFAAAAAALVFSTLLAVIGGEFLTRLVSPRMLKTAAGMGFIVIGLWTLLSTE